MQDTKQIPHLPSKGGVPNRKDTWQPGISEQVHNAAHQGMGGPMKGDYCQPADYNLDVDKK